MYNNSAFTRFRLWYLIQPVALRTILGINIVFFVAWWMLLQYFDVANSIIGLIGIVHTPISWLLPVQLVAYNFVNLFGGLGGLIHVFFMLSILFWFGKMYEEMHGSRKMWALYLLGGFFGALVTILIHTFSNQSVVLYSAIPAIIAVLSAIAVFYPHERIMLFFALAIPIRFFVAGLVLIELFSFAGIACVGAAVFGIAFALAEQRGQDWSAWLLLFDFRRKPAPKRPSYKPQPSARPTQSHVTRRNESVTSVSIQQRVAAPKKEQNDVETPRSASEEIDRILDKINEKGYESLTEREKKTLYEASQP